MTPIVATGQAAVIARMSASAAAGEGGSCGQAHTRSGRWAATQSAIQRALNDCGDERKPCR